jgi:tetratricopeptide (TPR) repeat protein
VTAYGIFFFFLSLAVESTVVPLHPIYEHRLYLPFAGISLGAATGVFILLDRLRTRKARTVLLAAVVIAPVLFGISAYSRNNVWSSSIALWEDTAKKSPNELRAHINLGNAYLEASRYEDAMRQYQRALQLRMPDYHTKLTEEYYSDAYYNIAVLNDKYFGDPQEAETAYLKSLRLNNSNVASMGNLGTLYYRMGDASKAESYYKAAVDKQPYYSPALTNLANLYILKKEYGRAIPLLQRALESTPTDPKAHYNIALAFRATGNMGEAIRHLKESLRDQPDYFLAASALGETYEMQQQPDKAIRSLEYALTIAGDGDNTGRTHYHLGRVLASIGRTGEAVEHLNKALKKYPGNKDIIRELRELEEVTH